LIHELLPSAHVHLNEPGRTDWEGFWTGTRAAASGGVTTVIDMPLNSIPPTTTVDNLAIKREAAHGQCHVDVGFWGGVIPGNQVTLFIERPEDLLTTVCDKNHLSQLIDAGVKGFKCFLIESGVDVSDILCMTILKSLPLVRSSPALVSRMWIWLCKHFR